jgi:ribosome-associated toxin RatA of RatAB toxin-antitoxin module
MIRKTCPLIEKEKCSLQNVGTVEMIVKYHFSQKMTDLFIAESASKITNQNQDLVVVDLEDQVAMVVTEALDLVEETTDHVKCLTQNAETVETIVKYHSSQKMTDLFIAEIVSKITNKIRKSF